MKTLIICDVQKEFMFCISKEYYHSLEQYIMNNSFDKIIVIVDSNNDSIHIPLWLYELEITILIKSYGSFAQSEMHDFVEEGECFVVKEEESWKDKYDNLYIATSGTHETFLVPEDMITEFQSLKQSEDQVELVGGAIDECLQDIEDALLYFDVNTEVNHTYTYDGYYRNQDTDWIEFDIEWVEIEAY